jgi:hypothetical protein
MRAMDTDSTRSLTYAEMAAVMGITLASAKNLTRRKRWARTRSNEGHVRILVPLDYLAESEGKGRREGPSASPHEGPVDGRREALGVIADLVRQLASTEAAKEAIEKALAEAVSKGEADRAMASAAAVREAAMKATLEAVRDERDRLLTREHLREQRRFWRRLVG